LETDVDRARAITQAVQRAAPNDVVLIAGKGHEDYQIVGSTRLPFSDLEQARRALSGRPRAVR
ncbi:MAG TPA: UDP-N-acetylmuramoyl-L-alanyl-D-glutamate--2,6-diaminopimelate ligase, partial [Burkholderiaceae bacterium]|nr:UDP-N-acetylmuramoyl-L-alanyl-D-glutamate--2,6-diaminopimelate ligase [Burkholderiaceae bacterium]